MGKQLPQSIMWQFITVFLEMLLLYPATTKLCLASLCYLYNNHVEFYKNIEARRLDKR